MSLDNTTKDESQQTSAGCATSGVEKTSTLKPPAEQILKCPRCITNNLASSIESLNSINLQQQQRLASLFTGIGGETDTQYQGENVGNYAQVNVDKSHGENVGNMNNRNNGIQGWNGLNDQYNALA
ncbi:hypothetical protein Tco_1228333 [Tanacetum coccineum]